MEYFTADTYKNWTRVGEPFSKNGKLYTYVEESCPRCGGSKKLNYYTHVDNGVCFKCGGSGYFTKEVRLYTEKEIETQRRASERRAEKVQTERQNKVKAAREKWLERNGFANGATFVIYGNTFAIKNFLKENGCKFSKDLRWHSPKAIEELPADCAQTKVKFETLYQWEYEYGYEPTFIGETEMAQFNNWTANTSEWVGAIGERLRNLEAVYTGGRYLESYGYYVHGFKVNENLFSWSTSKDLEFEEGDRVDLTGTVKAHKVFAGKKVTYLNRCVIKAI